MKNNKVAALFLAMSLLFIFSVPVFATVNDNESWSWDSLGQSGSAPKYYAYQQAVKKTLYDNRTPTNIPTFENYQRDPMIQRNVDEVGRKYIMYNPSDGYYVVGSQPGYQNQQLVDYFVRESENYGLANFGTGNFKRPEYYINNQIKDDFYNGGSNTAIDASGITQTGPGNDPISVWGDVYDLGNGYYIKPEFLMQVRYTDDDPWWEQCYDIAHVYYMDSEVTNLTISSSTNRFKLISKFPNYWISQENDSYYFNDHWESPDLSDGYLEGRIDITTWVSYVPPGMSENDIVPKTIKLWEPPTYNPVDGNDQSAVNEEIQKQNNDIISWLEKIYNAELMINSSINTLLSPLNSLYSAINNCYSVLTSILSKLDNLTVKLKDWNGNEFKIELGDLELGDLSIDFDVVYNITGITKITSPSDLTNKLPTYKSTLESKIGITNMKTSINNFTQALFGQSIFGQNGGVVSGTISESSIAPHWYFTFMGNTYDLFAYLSTIDSSYIDFWKDVVSFFLLLGTGLTVFKYIPVLVGNVSGAYNTVNADVEPAHMNDVQYRTYLNQKYG